MKFKVGPLVSGVLYATAALMLLKILGFMPDLKWIGVFIPLLALICFTGLLVTGIFIILLIKSK